ncbi:hypothetical protein CONPUDRAFT_82338 [Coniophora puteana RWD-64-598 SS2]|uniref:Uncharacterized protein n=1 Tax=Coniophora puteana (strain RWD-64-598) TaxID=741705 RepID=A0A5M3MQA2_CONPW|nr:uncharacterized protein CONPUDRAFT_82338 [Coniophora puteana RWD-64-598 SS2]EIW81352.1 hypothetical protein CONPUDRAFT_82338 [Coniophora puteana RWD-64-598 SS2]
MKIRCASITSIQIALIDYTNVKGTGLVIFRGAHRKGCWESMSVGVRHGKVELTRTSIQEHLLDASDDADFTQRWIEANLTIP